MKTNLFDTHPAELTPEQSRLSKGMNVFADTMEKKVFEAANNLNKTQDTQAEYFENEAADS